MKQSFLVQLIVEEEDRLMTPDIDKYYPEYFSYAMLSDLLGKAGFEVELVNNPGCKGNATIMYLKRKPNE